ISHCIVAKRLNETFVEFRQLTLVIAICCQHNLDNTQKSSMSMKSHKMVKLPAKEMILTRYKSAQQQRQLRNKDRSMKNITQLLKSPTKSGQKKPRLSPKKPQKILENSSTLTPKKLQLESNDAPQIVNVSRKKVKPEQKVWLKPTYEMKLVAKTNKRKLCTPQRDIMSLPLETNIRCSSRDQSPVYSELSMSEMVRIIEDTGQLDDEDLMEILTCPSPVWWEDPPEAWYTEKPILTRATPPKKDPQSLLKDKSIATKIINTQTNKHDPKFVRKQTKLEHLLNNIKHKSNKTDMSKHVDLTTNKDEQNNVSNETVTDKEADNETCPRKDSENRQSESTEEDLSHIIFHDDMLTDLENMEIPIDNNDTATQHDEVTSTTRTNDNKNKKPETPPPLEHINDVEDHLKTSIIDKKKLNLRDLSMVPKDLPPLKKYPLSSNKGAFTSPVSIKSSDESSSVDHEIDTISDTNIKYLIEDDEQTNNADGDNADDKNGKSSKSEEMEAIDDTSKVILDKIKQFFLKKSKNKKGIGRNVNEGKTEEDNNDIDKKNFITVYRIISDDIDDDAKSTIPRNDKHTNETHSEVSKGESPKEVERSRAQLNSFYKKCKSINRRKNNEIINTENHKKDITNKINDTDLKSIAPKTMELNGSVKYCFKCSSIFETSYCTYCNKSNGNTEAINGKCSHKIDKTVYEMQPCSVCEN
ncbi:uncharacterized protein LOC131845228, partial [Achroia grisella]|uniref:uncharacterized protein LOC131845228 n=1 Tax=Achroia grisella TaxID=688607 RepID=UPI0027D314A1